MEKKNENKESTTPITSQISDLLPKEIIEEISSPKFKSDKLITSCLKNNSENNNPPVNNINRPKPCGRFSSTKNLPLSYQQNQTINQVNPIQQSQQMKTIQNIQMIPNFQSGNLSDYALPQNANNIYNSPTKNFVPIIPRRRNVQSGTTLNYSSCFNENQIQNIQMLNKIRVPIHSSTNTLPLANKLGISINNQMINPLSVPIGNQIINQNNPALFRQNQSMGIGAMNIVNPINNYFPNNSKMNNSGIPYVQQNISTQSYLINTQFPMGVQNPNFNPQINQPNLNMNISQNINANINTNLNQRFNSQINQSNQISQKELDTKLESLIQYKTFKALLQISGQKLFIQLIKTCKGSLHFQKMLTSSSPSRKEISILVQIININLIDIMCDCYGNYFLQKFFPLCIRTERIIFLKEIQPNFSFISNNMYGNHCLQSLILMQDSEEEKQIIKDCVNPNELSSLCMGANSCHVIEKIIKIIPESERDFINTFVIGSAYNLCLDPNGIYIIREFIKNIEDPIIKSSLVLIFETQTLKLSTDQFGNFAIQDIINKLGERYCHNILNEIKKNIVAVSMGKFSSNVVDCIIKFYYENNIEIFYFLINFIFMEQFNLSEMLKNKYATFVIENSLMLLFSNTTETAPEKLVILRNKIYNYLVSIPLIKEKKNVWKILSEVKL
ncbi:MAG: hypothetical protein MJ252_25355 [archaeon]|nr:hypothetical protein [archaeon]